MIRRQRHGVNRGSEDRDMEQRRMRKGKKEERERGRRGSRGDEQETET